MRARGLLSYSLSEMNEAITPLAGAGSARGEARTREADGLLGRARVVLSGVLAAFLGLLPHVLHHTGPLAGAALFAGAGGSILFGAIGFVAAIPFLLRLHRRSAGWRVPAGVLALMVVMFSISTLVIGPKIAGSEGDQAAPATTAPASQAPGEGASQPPAQIGHEAHH